MKKLSLAITLLAMIAFTACKNDKKDMDKDMDTTDSVENSMNNDPQKMSAKTVTVTLESKSNSTAKGEVTFTEENGMVRMEAKMTGLKPGMHAIHIHENADCSAADGKSAGGHWNPTFEQHGKWGDPKGYHRGDIGNFEADENGNGGMSMQTDQWCIGCDDAKKNIIGKGIIVHEGTDDFVSQPSGDAGARVACGGIIE